MSSNLDSALLKQGVSSDEQLLAEYAVGGTLGTRSFAALFDRYHDRVHAYLMFKGALPDVAEDLAQEVFLRVVVSAKTFEQHRGSFRGWLFTITRNIFTDHLRHNAHRQSLPLEDCEILLSYMPFEILQVDSLLRKMKPELREPLELSVLCGLTAPEIAQVLDVPEGTVYSRISRARKKLRQKLDPEFRIKNVRIKRVRMNSPKPEPKLPPRDLQIPLPQDEDNHND